MGRVANHRDVSQGSEFAPLTEPIPTDLSVRDKAQSFDPVLASVVVAVGGTLALRPDRWGSRRRWTIRPGR